MRRNEIERLRLHYQPIVDLASGAVVAAEALLRDSAGKPLPKKTTERAERDGGIFRIDAVILEEACRTARRWRDDGLDHLAVHVNVSALELRSSRIARLIRKALDASGLEPAALQVEITETGGVADLDAAAAILEQVADLGAGIWLDDFGSGHSSLAWLKDFRVSGVKLPQLLVEDVASDPRTASIVAAVIALANELSMRVIAEGVETEEQVAILRAAGCHAIQGFYIARPVSDHELRAEIGRRRRRR